MQENISNNESVQDIERRKQKVIGFIKKKSNWIIYIILSLIIILNVYIRSLPLPRLKDITTGTWTLGPDLDPFLFLRWAEYIVEHGKLMVIDTMRYIPLGYNTAGEMKLLSYMIAEFYYIASFFSKNMTVTYAAILFPVLMSVFTAIAFFLFTRKIFYKESNLIKNSIAILSTLIFILIPSLLPRTIAGIPEKESAAFCFMFLAFYLFLEAFCSEKTMKAIIFAILSGLATAVMALIWGGFIFVFFTIPLAVLIAYLLGKVHKKEIYIYSGWLITSFVFMMPFSTRYAVKNLMLSLSTGFGILISILILISAFLNHKKILEGFRKKTKLPEELFYLLISLIIALIAVTIVLGPDILIEQVNEIKNSLITPIVDRFGMTVAENRQPYFKGEWEGEFGPIVSGIPLYFWLFFIGSIFLFNDLVKKLHKKERILLVGSYIIFLFCLIFSRYSPQSIFDGVSGLSILVYLFGWGALVLTSIYIYYSRYNKNDFNLFKEIEFSYILYFIVFVLAIIGARGGIRLIMTLGAISPVVVGFLAVNIIEKYFKQKGDFSKIILGILAVLIIMSVLFTIYAYYQTDKSTGQNYVPSSYTHQWQKAMQWVRENTSENAVFAHWWDYGYWIQSIGKRATILDGGNVITYWNHLLGRHVLCGFTEKEALEFLYVHNGTHLLIDSTDIGKYTAFSSIGSDEDYDKYSWIQPAGMDSKQTTETNNVTAYVYPYGTALDEDLIISENGRETILPAKRAFVGAIIVRKDNSNNFLAPIAIFVYNGQQYRKELNYLYFDRLYEFNGGLDAGVFVFPSLEQAENGQFGVNNMGAMMYLSKRTIHTNLVQLYLFNKKSENFRLVHTESNLIIDDLRKNGYSGSEFIYYQGFQGPIKIWEVKYPNIVQIKKEYLETAYPENIKIAKKGEYN